MSASIEQSWIGRADDVLIAEPGEPIVNVTAFSARQKVSGYVGREISFMMGGGEPALVYSRQRLVWRVPILLTTPKDGIVGVVGVVDVDARTSQLLLPSDLKAAVEANAQALIARSPYSTAG
jgi:hypothetical protein